MRLTKLFHSGFALTEGDTAVIIDYYRGGNGEGLKAVQPFLDVPRLLVLCSHRHPDHFDRSVLQWKRPGVDYIFGKGIRAPEEGQVLRPGEQCRWGEILLRAYSSTDEGVSFALEWGGKKLFHAGDLNNWYWTEEEKSRRNSMESRFLQILGQIQRDFEGFEAVMFPVDSRMGEECARGAEQFLRRFECGAFVPMHCWGGEEQTRALVPPGQGQGWNWLHSGESLEI